MSPMAVNVGATYARRNLHGDQDFQEGSLEDEKIVHWKFGTLLHSMMSTLMIFMRISKQKPVRKKTLYDFDLMQLCFKKP